MFSHKGPLDNSIFNYSMQKKTSYVFDFTFFTKKTWKESILFAQNFELILDKIKQKKSVKFRLLLCYRENPGKNVILLRESQG